MEAMVDEGSSEGTLIQLAARRRWVVLGSTVVFTLVGVLAAFLFSSRFESSATLIIQEPGASGITGSGDLSHPERYVADQVAILESDAVARLAIETLEPNFQNVPTVKDFRSSRTVKATPQSNVVEVLFEADDASLAQAGVEALVAGYRESLAEASTRRFVDVLNTIEASVEELEGALAEVEGQLDRVSSTNPQVAELELEYQNAVARLTELQQTQPADEAQQVAIEAEIVRITAFLDAVLGVRLVEAEAQPASGVAKLLAERDSLVRTIDDLEDVKNEVALDAEFAGGSLLVFSPAGPGEPSTGGFVQIILLSVLLGLLFGLGLALALPVREPK